MNWFERLTGFKESGYEATRAQLEVEGHCLVSKVNGGRYGIGELELVSLEELRSRQKIRPLPSGRLKVSVVRGDVGRMHQALENEGALFQVASQFNLLEMPRPSVTPDEGVTAYEHDRTQGPACAIAAGAATIYRNYFAPTAGGIGQTKDRQLDGLAGLGGALSEAISIPVSEFWTMRNGYALATQSGLNAIAEYLASLPPREIDRLRGMLRIGVHWNVEVTAAPGPSSPTVSQAFCSALPVSYTGVPASHWTPFASLVLEAAYEATIWAGALNAAHSGSNKVFLTLLGGGAFGNDDQWIFAALRRALQIAQPLELDVRLVSYNEPSQELLALAEEFQ